MLREFFYITLHLLKNSGRNSEHYSLVNTIYSIGEITRLEITRLEITRLHYFIVWVVC